MSSQTIKKNIIVGTDSQIQSRLSTDPAGTIYLSTTQPEYPVTDVKTSTNGSTYSTVLDGSVAKIDLSPYLTSHQTMLYRPVNMNGSEIIGNTASTAVNFAAGTNISLTNTPGTGTITISNTASAPSAATSSTAGLIKLGSDTVQTEAAQAVSSTTDRSYAVQVNSSGQMVVNVPWTGGGSVTLYEHRIVMTLGSTIYYFTITNTVSTAYTTSTLDTWFTTHAYSATSTGTLGVDWFPAITICKTGSTIRNSYLSKAADNGQYYGAVNFNTTMSETGYYAPDSVIDMVFQA